MYEKLFRDGIESLEIESEFDALTALMALRTSGSEPSVRLKNDLMSCASRATYFGDVLAAYAAKGMPAINMEWRSHGQWLTGYDSVRHHKPAYRNPMAASYRRVNRPIEPNDFTFSDDRVARHTFHRFKLDGTSWRRVYNRHGFLGHHGLLMPDIVRPQAMTESDIHLWWHRLRYDLVFHSVFLTFNSSGGGSSVNSFHWQITTTQPPVMRPGVLERHPVDSMVYRTPNEHWQGVRRAREYNVPHNTVMAENSAVLFTRRFDNDANLPRWMGTGASEMAGIITTGDRSKFDALDTRAITRSLWRFRRP